jgi:hypothetical protein
MILCSVGEYERACLCIWAGLNGPLSDGRVPMGFFSCVLWVGLNGPELFVLV